MPRPPLVTPLLWSSLGLSLACGAAAQALLALEPAAFATHWFRQPVVLVALHLTTLGFVGGLILGVLTQFLPMLLGRGLGPTALVAAALAVFTLGLLTLVGVFAGWRSTGPALAAGLALAGTAALILALAWPSLAHTGPRQRLCRATLASSLFYLVLTAGLGGLMAQGLVGAPRLASDPLELLKLHAHLGLFGFGSLMVFAVSYELLPMFNLAKGYAQWPGWLALGLAHLGLASLAASVFGPFAPDGPVPKAGECLLAAACLLYLPQVALIRGKALLKRRDAGAWIFAQACLALAASALAAPVLAFEDAPAPGFSAAVVYALLFGFLGGAITGQLQKILPLLSWVDRFSELAGRTPVPVAGRLLHPAFAWLALPLHGLACLSGCAGLAWRSIPLLRCSGCLGLALFLDLGLLTLACRVRGEAGVPAGQAPAAA